MCLEAFDLVDELGRSIPMLAHDAMAQDASVKAGVRTSSREECIGWQDANRI